MIVPILSAAASGLKQEKLANAVSKTPPQQCAVRPQGLGFTGAVLCGIILIAHSSLAVVASRASNAEDSLNAEMQHALAAVHATMVELPEGAEAAAIAGLAERLQEVRRENRQLADTLKLLKKDHAELIHSSRTEIARLRSIIDRSLAELRYVQNEREALQTQLAVADPEHEFTKRLDIFGSAHRVSREDEDDTIDSGRQIAHRDGSARQAIPASQPSGVKDAPAEPLNKSYTSPIATADPADAPIPSAVLAARQIVDGLRQAHRESLLEGVEKSFVLDVEERRFTAGRAQQPVQLDPLLSVSLLVGGSEVIDSNTGQIRFFPDGTSSGGKIQLRHGGDEAEVTVQWSNGEISLSPAD